MKAMLEELKALDPGTYQDIMENIGIFQFDDPRKEHIILGEVMRAIEARKWDCQQGFSKASAHKWAYIFVGKKHYLGEGDSPAEALLAAYIAALKG